MTYGDVLMVPLGLKGHIDPMMYVAKGLVKYGLTATVIVQDDHRSFVEAAIEEKLDGLSIHIMPPVKLQGPPWISPNAIKCYEPFFKSVLAEKQCGAPGPKCMVADFMQGWTQGWADKLQLPRYVMCPSPATFALVMNNFSALVKQGLLKGKDPNPVIKVPGTPVLRLSDLPPMVAKMPSFMTDNGDTLKDSMGILFNTFYELEPRAIDAFQAEVQATGTREKVTKMYPIGPMLPAEYFSEESSHSDSETIKWLNTRPDFSVLYVAFGSMAYLSPREVLELARGLAASKASFLWVLRIKSSDGEPVDVSKHLPPDFQVLTKDRGLIYTEFAPQLQILSHRATGGFLTHCGWNSALESICRGVPMLGWPMNAEQGLCCRVLVDEAKVATEVKKAPDGSVEQGVEEGVKQLMIEPLGKQLREKVVERQRQARTAIAPGGSSYKNVEAVVKDIQSLS